MLIGVPKIVERKNGAEVIFGDNTKIFPKLTKYKEFGKTMQVTHKEKHI